MALLFLRDVTSSIRPQHSAESHHWPASVASEVIQPHYEMSIFLPGKRRTFSQGWERTVEYLVFTKRMGTSHAVIMAHALPLHPENPHVGT